MTGRSTTVRHHKRTHPSKPYRTVSVHRHARKLPPGARGMPSPTTSMMKVMEERQTSLFDDAEVISKYTREDALEDGYLDDVSSHAREVGFVAPVAITPGVQAHIAVPKGMEGWQDVSGRQHDVLWMAVNAYKGKLRKLKAQGMPEKEMEHEMGLTPFKVIFQTSPRRKKTETLWLAFNSYEGFTIMRPEEY